MFALRSISRTVSSAAPRAARQSARPVLARAYHEKVISHYEQPRNVGQLKPLTQAESFYLITYVFSYS